MHMFWRGDGISLCLSTCTHMQICTNASDWLAGQPVQKSYLLTSPTEQLTCHKTWLECRDRCSEWSRMEVFGSETASKWVEETHCQKPHIFNEAIKKKIVVSPRLLGSSPIVLLILPATT